MGSSIYKTQVKEAVNLKIGQQKFSKTQEKTEQSIQELWHNIKYSEICVIEFIEGKDRE